MGLFQFARRVLTAASLLGLVILSLASANAQDFHDHEWVLVATTHPFDHVLERNYYDRPVDDSQLFYPVIASNAYPGAVPGQMIECRNPAKDDPTGMGIRDEVNAPVGYSISSQLVDEVLRRLQRDANWMRSGPHALSKISTYATGPRYNFQYRVNALPSLGYTLTPAGDRVNYIGCAPSLSYMAVRSTLTPDASFFMTIGTQMHKAARKPMLLDLMPMHELIHVHQNNYAPYQLAPYSPSSVGLSWIIEGSADAIAFERVFSLNDGEEETIRRAGPFEDKYYRRFYFLRNYNIPLNFEPKNSNIRTLDGIQAVRHMSRGMFDLLGYETNGFWYYVLERHLKSDKDKFTGLWQQLTTASIQNATREVDIFLDGNDGNHMDGLEHVYPQFLAEFTNWWKKRNQKKITEKEWLKLAYNMCETFDLSATTPGQTKQIQISEYSGKCLDINIDAAIAHRVNDIQLAVAGADQLSDEIYMGVSRIKGTQRGEQTCYDIVEQRGVETAPCLIDPFQGFANWKRGKAAATRTLIRTFNLTDLKGQSGTKMELRLVVVRTPDKHYDVVGELKRKALDVTVSLNLASLKPKSAAANTSDRKTVMKYANRQGEGPVSPTGSVGVLEGTLDAALRGDVSIFGGANPADITLDQMMSFEFVDEDEISFEAGFFIPESIAPEYVGPINVIGFMGDRKIDGSSVVSHQDPNKDSELEIIEHSQETMRVSGIINVCAAPFSALADETKDGDLCDRGEALSFEIEGAIALPTLVAGYRDFPLHSTPAYEAYKDLRIARLTDLTFGIAQPNGPPGNPGSPSTPNSPRAPGPASAGDLPNVCLVVAPSGACDCSCEAKACYEEKNAQSTITPREKACRLSCGKKWGQCAR